MTIWIKDKVRKGDKSAGEIGFPTVNLNPKKTGDIKEGIYSSQIKINGQVYLGVLFYGPRIVKNENNNVLEIHLLGFNGDLYGKILEFTIGEFVREVKNFKNIADLKKEIESDIEKVKELANH